MERAILVKEDFNIEKVDGNTFDTKSIYITPKVEDSIRNDRLSYQTRMTLRHTFNDDISYDSNNGTLGLSSKYYSLETLLDKAIEYYNSNMIRGNNPL
jgi:hypothetical protein